MILVILFSLITPIGLINKKFSSSKHENHGKIHNSAAVTNTKDWIANGNFTTTDNWTSSKGLLGGPSDVSASIDTSEEVANYSVLGDQFEFILVNSTPNIYDWTPVNNPNFPAFPDDFGINGSGAWASHYWDEGADQSVAVNWKRDINMPINMSDYVITSASLEAVVNASVQASPSWDEPGDDYTGAIDVLSDSGIDQDPTQPFQGSTGDYVRYYVWISDTEGNNVFEVAYNQTWNLGQDDPEIDTMIDTMMVTIPEDTLIYYLTSVLSQNYKNFTISIGMRIWCEDNFAQDADYWKLLVINSVSLNFTYERKIDQQTSISWNQVGDNPELTIADLTSIDQAILNFKYMANDTWPTTSPNSEIKIKINELYYPETIKLSEVNQTVKNASFDITSLIRINIDKEINLSIEVYLADEFELNQTITISIDNVSLEITYTQHVDDILTKLHLFLDNVNMTDDPDPVIEVPLGVNINITAKYMNLTDDHISTTNIQLEGKVNDTLTKDPSHNQYTAFIDTSRLGIGVKILTVVAQEDLYETQTFQFSVVVTDRETELQLYLNNAPRNHSDTITVEVGSTINVAVTYNDSITNTHISGAAVNIAEIGTLNDTTNKYDISINTQNFTVGKTLITILAQKANYSAQSVDFFVEVVERTASLQLFLNNEDKTSDSIYNLTIGQELNITVKYTNAQSGQYINSGTLELIGEGLSLTFTRNDTLEQYYLLLNTSELGIGIKLFTIRAQATDYQTRTISVSITINRIEAVIETETGELQIEVEVGEDILLQIIINDTIFGGNIKNANVTYNWAYGQGKLLDSDDDGIYEIVLPKVPVEVYTITISAFKSIDYNIESFELTLIVSEPIAKTGADLTWLIYVLIGGIVGLVSVFTLYQTHFKYPPMVRKIRKLRKKIRKGKKSKLILTSKRSEIIENSIREKTQIIELGSKTPDKKIDKLKEVKAINKLKEDKAINKLKEVKEINKLKEDKEIDDLKEDKEINDLKEDKEIDDLKEDKELNELKEKE